ncbi:hypothetical protein JCM9279_006714 [Rhodotorula babjevae]
MASQASLASSDASFWSTTSSTEQPARTSAESPRPSLDARPSSTYSSASTASPSRRTSTREQDDDARSAISTSAGAARISSGDDHNDLTTTPRRPPSPPASPPPLPSVPSRARSETSETAVELSPPVEHAKPAEVAHARAPSRSSSRQSHTVVEMREEAEQDAGAQHGTQQGSGSAIDSFETFRSTDDAKTDAASATHILPASTSTSTSTPGARSAHSYPPSIANSTTKPSSTPQSLHEAAEAAAAPPDGGVRAWLNVVGGCLVLFSSFGVVNALGAFQAYYEQFLFPTRSSSDIAWIGSCQLCLFFLCSLVVGPLSDKGYFHSIMAVGSGLFLIPQVTTYGAMMGVQGILGGLGVGFLFLPSMTVQSHWFARRRALAIGIVASGSSAGGVCFPIMLNRLFANSDVGFKTGVRACGFVVLACLIIANVIMRPNPARKHVQKPPPPPLKDIFDRSFSCLAVGAFLICFGIWFPNFYEQLYFQFNGASPNVVTYALAFFNAGSFFGRIIPNLVADYVGPFNVQVVCCFCAAIMAFLMRVMTTEALLIAHAILYGFFSGAFISLVSPLVVSMSKDLSEIGLRQGIAFLIVAGSSVGCNPIAGRLLSNNGGDWIHPIVFAGTMMTAGSTAMLVGRMLRAKVKGTWRV